MEDERRPKFSWARLEAVAHLRKWSKERYEGFKWRVKELIGILPDGESISKFPKIMEIGDFAEYYRDWTKADFEWLLDELEKKEREDENKNPLA